MKKPNQTYLIQIICNQIYLPRRLGPNRYYQSGSESTRYSILPRSPEVEPHHQMYFSVISSTLLFGRGEAFPSLEDTVSVF